MKINKKKSQIRKVKFGKNVTIVEPVNLYECKIGDNCFIGPFVEIQKNVVIGKNTRIQSHSFICENVKIGNNCFIGSGSVIRQGMIIKNNSFIQAGKVILKNY